MDFIIKYYQRITLFSILQGCLIRWNEEKVSSHKLNFHIKHQIRQYQTKLNAQKFTPKKKKMLNEIADRLDKKSKRRDKRQKK